MQTKRDRKRHSRNSQWPGYGSFSWWWNDSQRGQLRDYLSSRLPSFKCLQRKPSLGNLPGKRRRDRPRHPRHDYAEDERSRSVYKTGRQIKFFSIACLVITTQPPHKATTKMSNIASPTSKMDTPRALPHFVQAQAQPASGLIALAGGLSPHRGSLRTKHAE